MTKLAEACENVDQQMAREKIEAGEKKVVELPGMGHNSGVSASRPAPTLSSAPETPATRQHVLDDRAARIEQIRKEREKLPSVQLDNKIAEAKIDVRLLEKRKGDFHAQREEALEKAQDEFNVQRTMLEAAKQDAIKRRDAFLAQLNEEVDACNSELQSATAAFAEKKAEIIDIHDREVQSSEALLNSAQQFLKDHGA